MNLTKEKTRQQIVQITTENQRTHSTETLFVFQIGLISDDAAVGF